MAISLQSSTLGTLLRAGAGAGAVAGAEQLSIRLHRKAGERSRSGGPACRIGRDAGTSCSWMCATRATPS